MELERKRLKSLVRWAAERFHEDDDIIKLIEMVTIEFKPMADIAAGSKNARKLLKQLDTWIAQKKITRQLWVYMDQVLQSWRDLNRGDFLKSMLVFQTLMTMYEFTHRALDDQEEQFIKRMDRLLKHESVKAVMAHALQYPTDNEKKVMECMVYADAAYRRKGRAASAAETHIVPLQGSDRESEDLENEEASDDDSDDGCGINRMVPPTASSGHSTPRMSDEPSGKKMVLKRPFFRDWDNFIDFDLTFKHKMPITLSEFDLLLQKESESTKGWDVCVDRKEIKIAKVQVGFLVTLRAWAQVPGVDMHIAFWIFFSVQERVKWDPVFATMALVGDGVGGSEILYSVMKPPVVTPRDFLQYRRVRTLADGSICVVMRSAEHETQPEVKGYIRAESYISGYVFRQSADGSLNIFIMACTDIKGIIPKWVINTLAPRKPAEWVENLKKAAHEYQTKRPEIKNMAMQELEKLSDENPFDFEPEADSRTDDSG